MRGRGPAVQCKPTAAIAITSCDAKSEKRRATCAESLSLAGLNARYMSTKRPDFDALISIITGTITCSTDDRTAVVEKPGTAEPTKTCRGLCPLEVLEKRSVDEIPMTFKLVRVGSRGERGRDQLLSS